MSEPLLVGELLGDWFRDVPLSGAAFPVSERSVMRDYLTPLECVHCGGEHRTITHCDETDAWFDDPDDMPTEHP